MQQNVTMPHIDRPRMAAPAAIPAIAPLGSRLGEGTGVVLEPEPELEPDCKDELVTMLDAVPVFVGVTG